MSTDQQSDEAQHGSTAGLGGTQPTIDVATFVERLLDTNPWARSLIVDEQNEEFVARRKAASIDRFEAGLPTWNMWASKMDSLCSDLKSNGFWETIDKTGYWARRFGEPEPTEPANELTRFWLSLSHVDFRNHTFETSPILVRFQFPGEADFSEAVFPDGVNFAGAFFKENALFESTSFLGGGASFSEAEFSREAFFQSAAFDGDTEIFSAKFKGLATFDGARFADFSGFGGSIFFETGSFVGSIFNESVTFERARFEGSALFEDALFEQRATFDEATFSSPCYFYSTNFRGGGSFIGTQFQGDAFFSPPQLEAKRFGKPRFIGPMIFSRASFERFVTFAQATFYDEADFSAIQSKSSFSLEGTTFSLLPAFGQSDFKQAPQFDRARFNSFKTVSDLAVEADLPGRFRALRRLAIQGHDHDRELEFFAREMKARRGIFDGALGPNAGTYWFGILYQGTSDFGRSLIRPLTWWLVSMIFFACLYWSLHVNKAAVDRCSIPSAAIYVSFRKGAAIVNAEVSEKLQAAYNCLFGENVAFLGHSTVVSGAPTVVEAVMMLQTALSGLLLFLFAVAMRNRFRIR